MKPEIIELAPQLFVGMSINTSLVKDRTFELFRQFMPRRKEVAQRSNASVLDLKVYPEGYFSAFSPVTSFTKWALVEVTAFADIPAGMEPFELAGGTYARFLHRGLMTDNSVFTYIYSEWLPQSDYTLADNPHFDVLSEQVQLRDPEAEQEIWVPIVRR